MHRTTAGFWEKYNCLAGPVQEQASGAFELLKSNPRHPSLQFKKIGQLWSVRVTLNYRALALEHEGDFIWFWIGTHNDYDRLISNK